MTTLIHRYNVCITYVHIEKQVAAIIYNNLNPLNRAADGEGDGNTIATEKDRLDIELETYMSNKDQILDFNIVQSSVEHIKKIHDSKNEKSAGKKASVTAALGAFRAAAPIDLLQKYSETLTQVKLITCFHDS